MDKILFKSLSAEYIIKNEYTVELQEKYQSVFSCKYHLKAVHNDESNFMDYTINRSNILINNEPVRKLMDKIIMEIGNSIYPICLKVSIYSQILDVSNFEEIKSRWIDCTRKLLEKYPSRQLEKYVGMSKNNLSDKKAFIHSLYQDTFFNIYFRNIYIPTMADKAFPIVWVNFPKREMNQTYLYQINLMNDNNINTSGDIMKIVPDQQGDYRMNYKLGEKGEILSITGSIESKHQNKSYTKQISVTSQNLKTESRITENVII